MPGHWIVTGQNLGSVEKAINPCKKLYKPITFYKENILKPI